MRSINQRKMLFLYPENLSARDLKTVKDMLNLSQNLSFIINEVNDFIKKIDDKYLSNAIESIPKVECAPVSDYSKLVDEFHNVRICLVKHNNVDYYSSYDKVVKMYKSDQQDISHLISLTIDSNIKDNMIYWKKCGKNCFDVNILTNLNQLAIVLKSIMMDIVLYRHFNLSNSLVKRKNFSILKRDYIIEVKKNTELTKKYCSSACELRRTKYLSICFPKIFTYYTMGNIELNILMNELVDDYWKLIISTLFLNIKLQNNYVMYDEENQYKTFPRDVQQQISNVIPDFCNSQNSELPLLLAIKKNSLENIDCHIIKVVDDFWCLGEDEFNFYKLEAIEV